MSILSVVLPAYNEEQMVGKTCRVLHEVLSGAGISYELVLVNDGSKDNTWNEILKAGEKDPNILGVHFSRNFGKEAAVFAGLAQASGDVVAVMDCDLQHPAETLIEMYQKWKEGYEVIEGVKKSRGEESFFHKEYARRSERCAEKRYQNTVKCLHSIPPYLWFIRSIFNFCDLYFDKFK